MRKLYLVSSSGSLPEFFGIILRAFIDRKVTYAVGNNILRKPTSPCLGLESDVCFGSYHKECLNAVDSVEIPKIIVAMIKNIVSSFLVWNLRHCL